MLARLFQKKQKSFSPKLSTPLPLNIVFVNSSPAQTDAIVDSYHRPAIAKLDAEIADMQADTAEIPAQTKAIIEETKTNKSQIKELLAHTNSEVRHKVCDPLDVIIDELVRIISTVPETQQEKLQELVLEQAAQFTTTFETQKRESEETIDTCIKECIEQINHPSSKIVTIIQALDDIVVANIKQLLVIKRDFYRAIQIQCEIPVDVCKRLTKLIDDADSHIAKHKQPTGAGDGRLWDLMLENYRILKETVFPGSIDIDKQINPLHTKRTLFVKHMKTALSPHPPREEAPCAPPAYSFRR